MEPYQTTLKHLGLRVDSHLFLDLVGHGADSLVTKLRNKGAELFVCETSWTFYPNQVIEPLEEYNRIVLVKNTPLVLYGHKLGIRVSPEQVLFPQEQVSGADLSTIAKMLGGKKELVYGSWVVEIKRKEFIPPIKLSTIHLDTGKVTCHVKPGK